MDKKAEEYAERFAKATEKLCKDLKFSKKECEETVANAKKYWLDMYNKRKKK